MMSKSDFREFMLKELKQLLLLVPILFLFAPLAFWGHYQRERLITDGKITTGTVYETGSSGKGGFNLKLKYRFYIDGKEYKGSDSYPNLVLTERHWFINKTFPVLYLEDNPARNTILVNRYDFENYHLQFPDSLRWVEELENR